MPIDSAKAALRARLASIGARIEELRHHSAASSGVPYGGTSWSDIVATHGKLAQHLAEERTADANSLERLHADVESLALSLDHWIKGIDRDFGAKKGGS
ncbi:MAG: hypothetical protein R3D44_01155 [Hyphomicrobiaceae bacterium]